MTPSVVLVVEPADEPSAHPAIPRFLDLLDHGWDAHLVCLGGDPAEGPWLDGLPDEALRLRVHPPPRRLRRRRRGPGTGPGAIGAVARHPLVLWRQLRLPPHRHAALVLAALRPELVHVPSAAQAREWAGLVHAVGGSLVATLRGDDIDGLGLEPEHDVEVWRIADGLHLETAELAKLGRPGGPEHPLTVIPPVPDPDLLDVPPPVRAEHLTLRVLGLGPLSWSRGYEHVLRALRLLEERGVDFEYRLVGRGEFVDAVAFARHQLGLDGRVELVEPGGRSDLHEHLSWADVLLSGAVVPTSPKPVLDAWACGLAVVTTEQPSGGEGAAIVVPRRDPKAIALALATLASDPDRRRRLGEAGRTRALKADDRSGRLAGFRDLYRLTLERRVPEERT